jgi:membrane-associated phospholipid phosphatase
MTYRGLRYFISIFMKNAAKIVYFLKVLLLISFLLTSCFYVFRIQELQLMVYLQSTMSSAMVLAFQVISDSKSFISVGIPLAIFIFSFVKNNTVLRSKAMFVLVSLGLAGLLSYGIKNTIRDSRPYEIEKQIVQLSGGGGYGFPSGHVVEATAAAIAVFMMWPNLFVLGISFVWVLSIMVSRVYLGVHDVGQVFAGMFVGICCPLIVLRLGEMIRNVLPDSFPHRST